MAIYLGHITAQRILESRLVRDLDPTPVRGIINCTSSKSEVQSILSVTFTDANNAPIANPFYLHGNESLDILVGSHRERKHWKGASCHLVSSKIPERSYLQLAEEVLVATPELCYLQQCSRLSLVGAIMLAMSFCGIYRLEGDPEPTEAPLAPGTSSTSTSKTSSNKPPQQSIFDRSPIMTIESARAYLEDIEGVKGLNIARAALDYVIPYSGSPMETRFALPFYLPVSLGGYGLPRPKLNDVIALSEYAASLIDQQQCAGDIVWEYLKDRFILEYQSRERHDVAERYGVDYARQLALQADGHDVRFVTKVQLESQKQMEVLALAVASHLHMMLPDKALANTDARQKLFSELNAHF